MKFFPTTLVGDRNEKQTSSRAAKQRQQTATNKQQQSAGQLPRGEKYAHEPGQPVLDKLATLPSMQFLSSHKFTLIFQTLTVGRKVLLHPKFSVNPWSIHLARASQL
ncbi:hypothetical protein Y032_0005g2407 [Ancylostoma ceylanicum]|uniref:Uncharacterized protein n=1 Tax=Ancylostoma ceylanicum TaxID=53326 RepID=A0A016VRY2_9BILA|nr:hypothetical protein Y032_0005g2407 [Ancylostoma ceylanicum]